MNFRIVISLNPDPALTEVNGKASIDFSF